MDSLSDFVANPKSILIVDDNSNLREALVAVLENAGYEVFQASDGNAAISEMRQRPVALLITDLVMPEKEGFETMRQFTQEFPRMPMIAISGRPEYLPIAKALGAAAVLEKPIAYADLLQVVRKLIG
jgi:CheY-like chemotaxis protein